MAGSKRGSISVMAGDVASRFARQVGLSSAIELPPAVRKLLDEGRLNEAAEAMAMEAKKPLRGSVTETVDPSRGARKRGMTDASVDWPGTQCEHSSGFQTATPTLQGC